MTNPSYKNKTELRSIKEQYGIMDTWLKDRLKNLLPKLMKRAGIDLWIVLAREYNEDPVFLTLISPLTKTASRLSCLVFSLKEEGAVDCLSFSRPSYLNTFYSQGWDTEKETQWEGIKRIIEERKPKKIGINISKDFALADGLSKSLYHQLVENIGEEYKDKLVSAEKLAIGWLETRTNSELQIYSHVYSIAIEIIEEAFSTKVITVGQTKTNEVEWWMMQKISDLGLEAWFTPAVSLQRKGEKSSRIFNTSITSGDLLHCDIGIKYMGLCTDTQRLAYILKPEESDAPQGLKDALANCNQYQEIVAKHFKAAATGNQILINSLKEACEKGIKAMLYTHPIGYHGHGAGPTIGLWDRQENIPLWGDYPIYLDTCYALELNTAVKIPEWDNQEIYVYLEETVSFTEEGLKYMGNQQKDFILV